jgi:hypothetical protein
LSTTTEAEYTGEENTTGTTAVPADPPVGTSVGVGEESEQQEEHQHLLGDTHTHTADCVGGCIHREP